jgi:4-carboxymuconolactone decarboxylase
VTAAAVRGRERVLRRELRAALKAGTDIHRLHEALLQLVPFAGFGRAINAFWVLQELQPSRPFRVDRRPGRRTRGERLCRRIYGPSYDALMRRMGAFHPDLASWILEDGYGRVLARPGLSARDRELLAVAALAALGLDRQLESHVRGARRMGATGAQIRAVLRSLQS